MAQHEKVIKAIEHEKASLTPLYFIAFEFIIWPGSDRRGAIPISGLHRKTYHTADDLDEKSLG